MKWRKKVFLNNSYEKHTINTHVLSMNADFYQINIITLTTHVSTLPVKKTLS